MQPSYSQQYHELWRNHWWWQARHRLVLSKLGQLLPRCNEDRSRPFLLDIGCGGGWGFDDFSQFAEVFGLEVDPRLAESLPRWRSRIACQSFGPHYQSVRQY